MVLSVSSGKCPYGHVRVTPAKNIHPSQVVNWPMEELRRPHSLSYRTLMRGGGLALAHKTSSRAHPRQTTKDFMKYDLDLSNILSWYAARLLKWSIQTCSLLTRALSHERLPPNSPRRIRVIPLYHS